MTHVVVVGAGTSGCVVAARLSERADHAVTLIEAGPDVADGDRGRASYLDAIAAPGRTWPSTYLQGRGVGGSSAINGMLVTVPEAGDRARLGLSDRDMATLLPAEPAPDDDLGPLDRALLAADPDAVRLPLTRRGGVRCSVAEVYLAPARERSNLVLRTGIDVVGVITRRGRCAGIELAGGELVEADAVVIAAGAIHTPALLRRSGLGDPAIGDGLLDHPSIALTVEVRSDAVPDDHSLVTATALRSAGVEVLPMNHLGPDQPGLGVVMAAILRPESSGRVVVPDDPATEPLVELDWSAGDRERLAAAEVELRRLVERPPFAAILVSVADDVAPGGYSHACGSCRAALDERGAVRGTEDLYVCDASALPGLPYGGPMLATVAWAERFARRFG